MRGHAWACAHHSENPRPITARATSTERKTPAPPSLLLPFPPPPSSLSPTAAAWPPAPPPPPPPTSSMSPWIVIFGHRLRLPGLLAVVAGCCAALLDIYRRRRIRSPLTPLQQHAPPPPNSSTTTALPAQTPHHSPLHHHQGHACRRRTGTARPLSTTPCAQWKKSGWVWVVHGVLGATRGTLQALGSNKKPYSHPRVQERAPGSPPVARRQARLPGDGGGRHVFGGISMVQDSTLGWRVPGLGPAHTTGGGPHRPF